MMIMLIFSHTLSLVPIVDRFISHMALVHETWALSHSALAPHVYLHCGECPLCGYGFHLNGFYPRNARIELRRFDGSRFPHRGTHPMCPNGDVQRTVFTFAGCMVKYSIPKSFLSNPNTKPSIFSSHSL